MVASPNFRQDIVLFHAGESLLDQVAEWVRRDQRFGLRLVTAQGALAVKQALDEALVAMIDATQRPGEALDVMELALPVMGVERLAVYSETMHDGLELFVRVRGAILLLGPMEPEEWDGFFHPICSGHLAVRLRRQA